MKEQELYGPEYFAGLKGRRKSYSIQRTAFRIYEREIAKYVDLSRKRTLDIGCAMGGFVSECRHRGAIATGLDISRYALRLASKANGEQFFQANAAVGIPLADETVEVVTGFDVIEHLQDPRLLLAECHRVLRSKGWLFLSTPNALGLKRFFSGRSWNYDDTHVRFYESSELEALLSRFAFRVVGLVSFTESRFKLAELFLGVLESFNRGDQLLAAARSI